jgi:hypothetical protein
VGTRDRRAVRRGDEPGPKSLEAACRYAEDSRRHAAPQALRYAFQCADYPGALPEPGGLRAQPNRLMVTMRAAYNLWHAVREYAKAGPGQQAKWKNEHPELADLLAEARKHKWLSR